MFTRCSFAVCASSAIVTLFFLFSTAGVRAQLGFQPPSPEELRMNGEPLAPGAPAIILYREVNRDDDMRYPHEDTYFRIKILTEEGRKNASIEIPFFKQGEDIIHIQARTIQPDGLIVNFDGQVIERSVAKSRDEQLLAKSFDLPDVRVGSIIEYSYTDSFPVNSFHTSNWILNQHLFTKHARFSLKPSGIRAIRWSWQGLQPGSEPHQDRNGDHIIRMEVANIPAFQSEDFAPPENELKSRVDFHYENELYAQDQDTYWKKVNKAGDEYLEFFIGKRKAMEQAVGEIVAPTDPPEAKLRKIYDRVQILRNTSYEETKTRQEWKRDKDKIAENVGDVWKRGYGTGVQLTWLFLALVRAAGLEANGCWVSSRSEYFFSPKTMQAEKLDANVVLVKLNGKDSYFDPGAAYAPYGLLPWYESGTPGLCLGKDAGSWITTTLPSSSESRVERKAMLKLTDSGELEGTLTVTHMGLEAMHRRVLFRNSDDVARKSFLQDQLKTQIPVAAEVELTNKPDWSGSETPLIAEFHVKVPGWTTSAGKRAVAPVGLLTAAEKHIFEHATRIHSVYFDYPFEKLDDLTVELPAGWQIAGLPPAQNREAQSVSYAMKAENQNGVLHVTRKLNIDVLLLETKYYTALHNFFQIVRSGDEEQVILQPGPAIASK
jgi:hypothetical protein